MHDEDDLKLLLGGRTEEQESGIAAMVETFGKPLWSFVLRRFPGLRHEDVGEIVNDTFIAVWRAIEGGDFDVNQPLAPFVFAVARNKAIDRLRRLESRLDGTVDDDIGEVADRIQGTDAGEHWRRAASVLRAQEIQEAFVTFVRSLPAVQRAVGQVMADNFPCELSQEETAQEIYRRTGTQPTVVSVKRARSQIRDKFRELLATKESIRA